MPAPIPAKAWSWRQWMVSGIADHSAPQDGEDGKTGNGRRTIAAVGKKLGVGDWDMQSSPGSAATDDDEQATYGE